ncbi:phosphoinositide phosphatase SAC3-like [Gossypium australe]|uniref:Phosphoinositide phosphatase SAC3-like n=1 Tax=Gossypium australe TaxID=47621 RepID=A0A5B6W6U2_9ROSI|nr:phosphoinositide phosphatase SAC3-like [Gossypium australe]
MESSAAKYCCDNINNHESSSQSQTSTCMQKFRLYETRSNFYMIGRDKSRTYWRVLKIDRLDPSELNIREDSTTYTESECSELLRRIHEGNISTGGLRFVTICYGIVGFIKFLGPYYMLLITKRRQIGSIRGHNVYAVSKTEMIPVPNATVNSSIADSKDENRSSSFLFANTLCQVLYETMFVWNEFLTRGIRNHLQNTLWTVALVYGFFKQATLSVSGRDFKLTLIARRSRHYAGTRYLKRGVNEKGRVANDVETEQIVFEDVPDGLPAEITSVVQNRGSIPLFWSQETSRLNLKPDIICIFFCSGKGKLTLFSLFPVSKKDKNYEATRLHFQNLVKRYGNPIIILNLIKTQEKKPRESILRQEFANAIDVINKDLSEENRLRFLHWDLHKYSRSKATNVLLLLGKVAAYALMLTGFFYCRLTSTLKPEECMAWPSVEYCTVIWDIDDSDMSHHKYTNNVNEDAYRLEGNYSGYNNITNENHSLKPPTFQRGVLRTNCIDCLDRTNVAQYAYGLAALGHQLHALGIKDTPKIDLNDPLADNLMGFYERMGDTLAHQYGGSAAHNKIFQERRGQWRAATQSQEFFRTLQRYYSNAYMDAEKQDAINVFLGHFQPQPGKPALWELGSDQHYRGRNGETTVDEDGRSFFKRSFSDGNILRQSISPMPAIKDKKFTNSTLPNRSQGSNGLSESSPEISTCESDISCSRYTPSMPRRQLFGDVQRDRYLETGQIFFSEHGDGVNCSNFVDLDWLSSSGNSCEDEPFERYIFLFCISWMLQNSTFNAAELNLLPPNPTAQFPFQIGLRLSSENVVNGILGETTPSTSEYGSSMKGMQQTGTEEFPQSFVQWVNYGQMLSH